MGFLLGFQNEVERVQLNTYGLCCALGCKFHSFANTAESVQFRKYSYFVATLHIILDFDL